MRASGAHYLELQKDCKEPRSRPTRPRASQGNCSSFSELTSDLSDLRFYRQPV